MNQFHSFAFLVLWISFSSGCAFKPSEAKPNAQITVSTQNQSSQLTGSFAKYEYTVSSSKEGDEPTPVSAMSKLTKTRDRGTFESGAPLVLPSEVPDAVTLTVSLDDSHFDQHSLFGEVKVQEKVIREIPLAAFAVARSVNSTQITFSLSELKSIFDHEKKSAINIALYSQKAANSLEVIANITLSTPPSKISINSYFPISAFEKKMKVTLPNQLRSITSHDGKVLELGGLFEITNLEAFAIDLEVPEKLSHTLESIDTAITVNASECTHSVSRAPFVKTLNADLYLKAFTGELAPHLLPGATTHIGVYALGTVLNPKEDRLSLQQVATRCMAHCQRGAEGDWSDIGKWGWDCFYCGQAKDSMGEPCFGCMRSHREWCRWQDWRDWKDYANVAVGNEYALSLAPGSESTDASNFLGLKFEAQSVAWRKQRIIKEKITFKR